MSERLIIEFDNEPDKPVRAKAEDRIIIDLEEEEKVTDKGSNEESSEDKICRSNVSSFYKGNTGLSNSFITDIKFPEGIEQGFRKKFSINLKDEFFNSLLENNRYIITTSKSGNVYVTDKFSGRIKDKIFFDNESFEKTGLVHNNIIYTNSLKKIFRVEDTGEERLKHNEIFSSGNGFFIWSNLNLFRNNIVFSEFDPYENKATVKTINTIDPEIIDEFDFEVKNYVSDKICITGKMAFILTDNRLLAYDLEKTEGTFHPIEILIDENSFIFYLNNRIYITTKHSELYYFDIPALNYILKNTGIKNNYINSIGGFDDNIFAGTLDGWKYYKSSG
ncbi:MAG: hypothetical protein M3P82_06625, partial [Bacteroidota bacterium]|nr:hypothetical protein [Bacteroidota bacterium]